MRKVISNTTPILSLLKINKLNILKELYGEIIVPNAVFLEIEEGKNKPYYTDLKSISWINILSIQDSKSLDRFEDLDAGEAEVIILANEINADLIIIDEILGRKHANILGLRLTGTLGILLKAKEEGHINSLKYLLDKLQEKGTWLNPKLIKSVLKLAKEN